MHVSHRILPPTLTVKHLCLTYKKRHCINSA
nr:MAG TPA: Peptide methionine sulfoxide reductase [Caudoviricetes sp.]